MVSGIETLGVHPLGAVIRTVCLLALASAATLAPFLFFAGSGALAATVAVIALWVLVIAPIVVRQIALCARSLPVYEAATKLVAEGFEANLVARDYWCRHLVLGSRASRILFLNGRLVRFDDVERMRLRPFESEAHLEIVLSDKSRVVLVCETVEYAKGLQSVIADVIGWSKPAAA